jgi:uncharacterized protein with LGFP repeats
MQWSRWVAVGAALCAALAAAPPALAAGSLRRVPVPLSGRSLAAQGGWRVVHPVRVSGGFRLFGLHWRGSGTALFQARVRELGGHYGAWFALDAEDLPVGAERRLGTHFATESAWVGHAGAIQVRYRGSVASVTALVVDPGADPKGRAPAAAGGPGAPAIVSRAAWGADEHLRRHAPRYASAVRMAFVHHTATPNGYAAADSAAIVRSIYLYHVRGNGWDDIGYNFLVDRFGRVFEGRYGGVSANVIGAHTGGFNVGSFGVAVIGDFNAKTPSTAAVQSLERLLAWRLDVAHVDPRGPAVLVSQGNERFAAGRVVHFNAISGHRDAGLTDCPGQRLYALLPTIRTAVAAMGTIKIYAPSVQPPAIQLAGSGIRPIAFAARLSHTGHWRVRVATTDGKTIASFTGTGTQVAATWNGSVAGGGPLPPAGDLRWSIDATRNGTTALTAAGGFGVAAPPPTLTGVQAAPAAITSGASGTVSYTLNVPAATAVAVQTAAGAVIAQLQPTVAETAGAHTATWTPGNVPSGHYRFVVAATPSGGAAQTAYAAVDVRRQVSGFTVTPAAISPNGDGVADAATIDYTRSETGDAALQLLAGGKVAVNVASLYAQAPQAFEFHWAAAGVPDGTYQLRLLAPGAGGALDLRLPIVIDTHGPGFALSRVSQTKTRYVARIRITEPGTIQVRIAGRTVSTVKAAKAGRLKIAVARSLLRSRHTVTLVAIDRLGNVGAPFKVRLR